MKNPDSIWARMAIFAFACCASTISTIASTNVVDVYDGSVTVGTNIPDVDNDADIVDAADVDAGGGADVVDAADLPNAGNGADVVDDADAAKARDAPANVVEPGDELRTVIERLEVYWGSRPTR